MSDIFLSYASEDLERARALARALGTQGLSVFWDRNIPAGTTWRRYLQANLEEARCVVVAWSEASIRSDWVGEEVDDSRLRGIPIVPVLFEKVLPLMGFRNIQAADLSEWNYHDRDPAFQKLIKDITRILGVPTSREDDSKRSARFGEDQTPTAQSVKGWVGMPFRPNPLADSGFEVVPPFRIGATEVLSPDPAHAGEGGRGAGGTMAFPLPPNAKQVLRFRVAGNENLGEIIVKLLLGGWDRKENIHVRKILVDERISDAPFFKTYEVDDAMIDPGYNALSVWLRGTRRTSVSLVAIEFAFIHG